MSSDSSLEQLKAAASQTRDEALSRSQRANDAIKPAKDRFSHMLEAHPIITTYAGIFSMLAALPVGVFLLYALFSAGAIFAVALVIALGIVGVAFAVLIAVLISIAFVAAVATSWVAGLYLTWRLASNVSNHGSISDGLQAFAAEIKGVADGHQPAEMLPKEEHASDAAGQINGTSQSASTSSSPSLVASDVKHEAQGEE